jgi:hypothetical protein
MTIQQVLDEGRLIRGAWSGEGQLLCLYTAMTGDPDSRPKGCPASLCPQWLAYLLPWIDDEGSAEHWPAVVARVARLAPRFSELPPETEWRVRALCVREAMRHTDAPLVLAVCERIASSCESGVRPSDELKDAARKVSATAMAAGAAEGVTVGVAPSSAASAAGWAVGAAAAVSSREKSADRLIDAILDEIDERLRAS